jgi:tRNA/tmRNA/rRNA uracil-C5-methylase (TrmA/RlmC/RlmD family)
MRSEDVTSVTISGGTDSSGVPLAPGDVVELVAGEAAHGGWCVARLDGSGPVVFIRHALPAERVRASITEVTAGFARADAIEILAPSADRVEPPCPYARPGGCGGCDWQHASLPAQRELKASVVRQQLRRIAGIDQPVTVEALPGDAAGDTPGDGDAGQDAGQDGGKVQAPGLGWRTRVKFAVRADGVAGLRAHRSHEVINVADCLIAHPGVRDLGVPEQSWPRAASVEAVVSTDNGERAEIVSGHVRIEALTQATAESVLTVAGRSGAGRNGAGRSGAGRSGASRSGAARRGSRGEPGGNRTVRGHSHLLQRAAGRTWRVSATGFWQVHPAAADTLARAVLAALRPQPGDTALDLYCGAGLFTGVLAAAVGPAGTVVGVESGSAAVRDARRNLRETPWASVYQGDASQVIAGRGLPVARLAVLDPPRAGAARDVIEYLARPAPGGGGGAADAAGERRIAYVSCDPATLARDIAIFAANGWRLANLRAFDAFPMTHHVECLATLVPS